MSRSDYDGKSGRSVMGAVMKRHGHDAMTAAMTAHDTISVIRFDSVAQGFPRLNDTMTLDSSKWRDKWKMRPVKHPGHSLRPKSGGQAYLAETSVMPS